MLETLNTARYRSAAGTAKVVVVVEGKQRKIIRGFEDGNEVWSASRAEIRNERGSEPQGLHDQATGTGPSFSA